MLICVQWSHANGYGNSFGPIDRMQSFIPCNWAVANIYVIRLNKWNKSIYVIQSMRPSKFLNWNNAILQVIEQNDCND